MTKPINGANLLRKLMHKQATQRQDLLSRHAVSKASKPDNRAGLRSLKLNPGNPNPVPLPFKTDSRKPLAYLEQARAATEARIAAGEDNSDSWDADHSD